VFNTELCHFYSFGSSQPNRRPSGPDPGLWL